jgi:hypothetical protein
VTVIVYGPGPTFLTMKLPVKLPPAEPATAQLGVPTGVPEMVQVVAVELIDPLTLMIDPFTAVDGDMLMAVTVKVF